VQTAEFRHRVAGVVHPQIDVDGYRVRVLLAGGDP